MRTCEELGVCQHTTKSCQAHLICPREPWPFKVRPKAVINIKPLVKTVRVKMPQAEVTT
jgi:hypothetical protein